MSWENRRVLVTGAGGFVGANLVRKLLELGAAVYAQVRRDTDTWRLNGIASELQLLPFDLSDSEAMAVAAAETQPEYVFHLAVARSASNPALLLSTNVGATVELMRCTAGKALKRFVHAGSTMEYGAAPTPYRETVRLEPTSLFGASKAAATLFVLQAAHERGLPACVLRLFHVYGPWESPERLIPKAIQAALGNETLALTRPGLTHDLVFVDDVVDALLIAATADGARGQVINVASGRKTTNEEVVAEIGRLVGHPIAVRTGAFPERSWDRGDWVADVSSAADRLGWRAASSLSQGLRRTIDWTRDGAGSGFDRPVDAQSKRRDTGGRQASAGVASHPD